MKTKVIWEGLLASTCRRRSCFYEKVERYHEWRSNGSSTTGPFGLQSNSHLPVVKQTIFKTCGRRRYGCPERFKK